MRGAGCPARRTDKALADPFQKAFELEVELRRQGTVLSSLWDGAELRGRCGQLSSARDVSAAEEWEGRIWEEEKGGNEEAESDQKNNRR